MQRNRDTYTLLPTHLSAGMLHPVFSARSVQCLSFIPGFLRATMRGTLGRNKSTSSRTYLFEIGDRKYEIGSSGMLHDNSFQYVNNMLNKMEEVRKKKW